MPLEAGEVLSTIFEVIEGEGGLVGEAVEITTDSGITIADGTATAVEATNGAAAEVVSISEAGGAASGAGLLALDVGVAGAAIAPALGILAGVGLYNLAPEFWTNVSNALVEAGQTIGGKVMGIVTSDGKFGLSEETIEIFKNAFINAGLFDQNMVYPDISANISYTSGGVSKNLSKNDYNAALKNYQPFVGRTSGDNVAVADHITLSYHDNPFVIGPYCVLTGYYTENGVQTYKAIDITQAVNHWGLSGDVIVQGDSILYSIVDSNDDTIASGGVSYVNKTIVNGVEKYIISLQVGWGVNENPNLYNYFKQFLNDTPIPNLDITGILAYFEGTPESPNLQPDADYPEINLPFPQTYPDWQPIELPQTMPQTFPAFYPLEYPFNNPDQGQAQDPSPDPLPDPQLEFLLNTLPIPDPIPDLQIQPQVKPDPDPLPEPQPAPKPEPVPKQTDPIDPNPSPQPNPLPVVFPTLDTVNSTKLFTVYAPTQAQLDALGGFLWSSNILDEIKKIWQNPLDGIISLAKVYVSPVTGSSHNIILGNLDSEVSSLVVTSQFVDVNCGSVTIPEEKRNATDYSPYSTVHIYLPFIGIHELDVDEIMGGSIRVLYHVDVYTGTCLADILLTRTPDVTTEKVIYTFSGNCSQSLPLTSSSAAGMIHAILGLGAGAISVAGGGALGAVAAASMVGQSLTHEMLHVGHSGNLSANAGIMGQRKPFVIISRRHGYDANGYNDFYGYPSNKTVYLSNCSGFVRIKDIKLHCPCTDAEEGEILSLLSNGVYL